MIVQCDVYRSLRHDNMYLYVREGDGLSRVPEALLARFGPGEKTLSFELTPKRRLAKEDPVSVLGNLEAQGYHLQLPSFRTQQTFVP
ncbi:MAG: YcgL domain-containing protein [Pseudohongiellaceae bacterium]